MRSRVLTTGLAVAIATLVVLPSGAAARSDADDQEIADRTVLSAEEVPSSFTTA